MLKTANNVAIRELLLAVARAHAAMPGYDIGKSKELVAKISPIIDGARRMEAVTALAALLVTAFDDDGDRVALPFRPRG